MNSLTNNDTIYIFLDESGNLDFNLTGTRHFVLSAIATTNPVFSAGCLQKLKYEINLSKGGDVDHFHASEDFQKVRDRVFAALHSLKGSVKIHYIYGEKAKLKDEYKNTVSFYSLLGKTLCNYLVNYKYTEYANVMIVFDKALSRKDEKAFVGHIKPLLAKSGGNYRLLFHRTLTDFNAQIADYCAWARYVSLERDENRPLQELSEFTITDFNILEEPAQWKF
jgi:hypothetical protein